MTSGTHTTTLRSHSSLAAQLPLIFQSNSCHRNRPARGGKKNDAEMEEMSSKDAGSGAERCHVRRKEGVQAGKGVAPGTLSPSSLPTNVRTSLSICLILGHYGLCI